MDAPSRLPLRGREHERAVIHRRLSQARAGTGCVVVVEGSAIADKLFISPHTVNSHVRHVFEKLGINSRVHLTRLAAGRSPGQPG